MLLNHVFRAASLALMVAIMPSAVHAESLTQALTSAYLNNPDIASALLSVKISAEDIALRKAGKLPTIGLGADFTESFSNNGSNGGFTDTQAASVGLTYRQTLFDNLRTDAQIEQARALVEVSKQGLRNAEQNVLLQVAQAYMNVVRDTQLVQLRSENVSFLQTQVGSAQERLNIGEGTKVDLSQAQTSLAQGVAGYKAAIASLQTSQATYERFVGHKPQNLNTDFRFGNLLPTSLDAAIASAEANHPAILSAKAAIRASQSNSDAAAAAFGPTLDLIGSLQGSANSNNLDPAIGGSVRLTLSIPLYAGGALGAGVRRANLSQMKSEVDALSTRDQVKEAVITAWSTMQNAAAQIEAAQSTLSSAGVVLNATVQSRDVGQSTTLDVLDAQATVTQAREALIAATSSRIIASFALVSASGKLSATELGLPVEIKSADAYAATVEDVWQELRAIDK